MKPSSYKKLGNPPKKHETRPYFKKNIQFFQQSDVSTLDLSPSLVFFPLVSPSWSNTWDQPPETDNEKKT